MFDCLPNRQLISEPGINSVGRFALRPWRYRWYSNKKQAATLDSKKHEWHEWPPAGSARHLACVIFIIDVQTHWNNIGEQHSAILWDRLFTCSLFVLVGCCSQVSLRSIKAERHIMFLTKKRTLTTSLKWQRPLHHCRSSLRFPGGKVLTGPSPWASFKGKSCTQRFIHLAEALDIIDHFADKSEEQGRKRMNCSSSADWI